MKHAMTRFALVPLLAAGWITAASVPAHAGILDWMQEHAATLPGDGKSKAKAPADDARLVTLEPGQTELYPKPSPDGRFLLTLVQKGKHAWISRRYAENGDPANVVTEDARAFDSFEWEDAGHVYFLSTRAGGLGLWDKIADGEGMVRRLMVLHGRITQPVLLKDGAVIAVRLLPERASRAGAPRRAARHMHGDGFNSWRFPGFRAEIVRIEPDGAVRRLSEGVNPALSPDGQWVAFSMPVGRSYHLFRMHPDGSALIQVTSARSVDVQPAWSRDGKWILFTSNRAHPDMRGKGKNNWDVWAIQPDGRNLTRLTADGARDGAPRMGKDGQVYFHSDRAVPKPEQQAREVKRVMRGFHVWRIGFPAGSTK